MPSLPHGEQRGTVEARKPLVAMKAVLADASTGGFLTSGGDTLAGGYLMRARTAPATSSSGMSLSR
jgi:hypothetical protein